MRFEGGNAMTGMSSVALSDLIDKMELKLLTPDVDISKILITQPDINRPALQLTGFFDHFDSERVQVVGYVEHTYLQKMTREKRIQIYEKLLNTNLPCIIFCRNLKPDQDMIEIATKHNVPLLSSERVTSPFIAEIIRRLNVELSPSITVHGVLVDVYGEGILIMGESGIGKSEAALELIRRGHRLVTDDIVEIHRVSDERLIGTAPDVTRYFIELRGIGILDVKALFGVESVKETQAINMVIKLEEWDKEKEYDRLGLVEEYTEFLGINVVCHAIPIRPGRNLAVIVESAAVNYRQKKMGYNAAQELYRRVQENIDKKY